MSHIHPVIDTDVHYKIDGVSRTIVNIDETKRELVQNDHNSERFTFEMPRHFDGHDFSECNIVQVHYENADTYGKNKSAGIYTVDDLHISSEDDETVVLSWLISGNATKFVGTLGFSIRFACITETTDYAWNTKRFDGITILQGVYNSESIAEQYPDVITEILAKLDSIGTGGSSIGSSLVGDLTGENSVILRNLSSGVYTLEGGYRPYEGGPFNITDKILIMVDENPEMHYVQMFYPAPNAIHQYKITDKSCDLNIVVLTPDTEYNAESRNAQSGVAVAKAIEQSLGYVNEVLATLVEVE